MKRLGIVLGIMMALGVVMASSALAAPSTSEADRWKIAGKTLAAGTNEGVRAEIGETAGVKKIFLESKISGTAVKLEATGIESPSANIRNTNSGAVWMAEAEGTLTFTGVKFVTPSTCKVTKVGSTTETIEKITTNNLLAKFWTEGTAANQSYIRFAPVTGEVFAAFGIGTCALATKEVQVKGTVFGRSPNKLGTEEKAQPLDFSEAINTAAGGALKLGAEPAVLTGRVLNKLSGGAVWGANKE